MRRAAALMVVWVMVVVGCSDDGGDTDDAADGGDGPTTTEEAAAGDPENDVEWGGCPFQVPQGIDIECGTLDVPAERGDPDSGTVNLAVAIVRTDHDDPADDPLVYLSGGPGQGTLEMVPEAFGALYGPLVEERDLVLLDQRGTGFSEPSLACTEYSSWVEESLDSELPPEELADQAAAALDGCRERLVDEGVDLSHYNSAASAADLEDLRAALGYDEWNLYGISYGTRLAQTAMRDHPDGIRSVVLDSAYPITADLYEETPRNAVRAMDELFALCAADTACQERFPDLEQTFTSLVEDLNENPVPIRIPRPESGTRVESQLDGDALAGFVFQSLYATDLVAFLPEIIDQASDGELGTIGLLLGAFMQQLDVVSIGMQLAVQCQEEVPFSDEGAIAEAAAEHELVSGFFQGAVTLGPGVVDVCERWEAGEPDAEADEPVESDIPTLVLAGELDPITPPRWGEEAAEQLSDSAVVMFPHTGHGAVGAQECARRITLDFLADPGSDPDESCIEGIDAPAFTAASVDVEMTPYRSEQFGFTGVRPAGWTEVLPGVFQESPLASMLQQVVPGATAEQVLQQIATQMGTDQVPEPVDARQTELLSWDLYELDDLGQRVDLALAEHEGRLVLIQVASSPERRDVYRAQVFEPAIEAFEPGQ